MQTINALPDAPAWLVFPVRNGKVRCEVRRCAPTRAVVVVTMGSASYRHHPVTYKLAEQLSTLHITTVLADLLTLQELSEHCYRFDTEKICSRLELLVRYLRSMPAYRDLPLGMFGGGTGANAVLTAAARMPGEVRSLVCLDGITGMENSPLDHVAAPTLLLHHQDDPDVVAAHEHTGQHIRGWCMVEKSQHGRFQASRKEVDSITAWFSRFLLSRNLRMAQPELIKIHA